MSSLTEVAGRGFNAQVLLTLCVALFALLAWWAFRLSPSQCGRRLVLLSVACSPAVLGAALLNLDSQTALLRVTQQGPLWLSSVLNLWLWWRLCRSHNTLPATRRWLRDAGWLLSISAAGLAAADLAWAKALDRLSVVLVIDHSQSTRLVPNVQERLAREITSALTSMQEHDRLASVVFAAQAELHVPLSTKATWPRSALPAPRGGSTHLERALNKALTELPLDSARKIVLLSDGVATRGDTARAVARAVAGQVRIDVLPLEQQPLANVRLLKLSAPTSVAEGETFELRLVIDAPRAAQLDLELLNNGQILQERRITADAGQTVLSVRQLAQRPGLQRLEVKLASVDPRLDLLPDDNQLAAFVHVRGQTHALLLTRATAPSPLEAALTRSAIAVERVSAAGAPKTAEQFAAYDLLVLEDLPARDFSAEQLTALANAVRAAGSGLLMLGSASGFGPGGYTRTALEQISPVSFELKQDRRRGQLSQVVILDASGSMAAPVGASSKMGLANEGAVRSLQLLNRGDRFGVLHVDTQLHWTLRLSETNGDPAVAEVIRKRGAGGGGIVVDPALRSAYAALGQEPSALKHVLLFADGNDAEAMAEAQQLASGALQARITTSVVALGAGSALASLEQISSSGQGRFYLVEEATRIPAVFAEETIAAARSALSEVPFAVSAEASSDIVRGIDFAESPALGGYVITVAKPRAQVLLNGPERDPILAVWGAGVGRSAAFTSDYGRHWGRSWLDWPGAAQLFGQLARGLARTQQDAQLRVETVVRDGVLTLSVDAVDHDGSLDTMRALRAWVAAPDGELTAHPLRIVAPGRYASELPLEQAGAYLITIQDALLGKVLATTGATVSALDELRPTGTDFSLLRQIAAQTDGQVRDTLAGLFRDRLPGPRTHTSLGVELCLLSAAAFFLSLLARRWAWPSVVKSVVKSSAAGLPGATEALQLPPQNAPELAQTPVAQPTAVERLLQQRRAAQRSGADKPQP